jgi:site-specific DNA-methyltransferase (adenine-specific)
MTAPRKETLADGVEIWLGDCRDVLPLIGRVDAVVTDPPYGISITKSPRLAISRGLTAGGDWDDAPADVAPLVALAVPSIIWGGNYFDLPATRCPLVWDKNNAGRDFADFEMAWTNLDMVARRIVFRPMNMDGGKLHPAQKPIEVMRWCVSHLPDEVEIILDPYMGSGSTGCAAVDMGRSFIGIEREPKYYDIARRRITEALSRPRLPFDEPVKPKQESLL